MFRIGCLSHNSEVGPYVHVLQNTTQKAKKEYLFPGACSFFCKVYKSYLINIIKGDNINSVNTKTEDNNDCTHVAMMVLMKTMTTMIMMKIVTMMTMLTMIVRIGVAISIPGGCTHVGPSSSSVNNEHQQNKELITIKRTTFTKGTCQTLLSGFFRLRQYPP